MSEQLKILGAMLAIVLAAPAVVLTYAASTESSIPTTSPPSAIASTPTPVSVVEVPLAPPALAPVLASPPPIPNSVDERAPLPPSPQPNNDDDRDRVEIANPREVKDVLRQIKDLLRELKGLEKQAKKAGADAILAKAGEIRSALVAVQLALKAPSPTRDTLQDFHDARFWEEINPLRSQIELPKQLKDNGKQIARLERKLKQRRYKVLGEEMLGILVGKAAEVSKALAEAKTLFDQGNFEDANEAIQVVHQEFGPWDIENVADRFSELYKEMKRVKDPEIRAELDEFLLPVVELVKEGDLREANNALNDVFNEVMQVIYQATNLRGAGRARDVFDDRFQKLQDLLEKKLEQSGSNDGGKSAPPPPTPQAEFK